MNKQIIKLTESDLHSIIMESVNRIINESLEDEFEAAKAKVKALKGKGNKAAFLAAAQEYQRLKELIGKDKTVINPSANWSDEENEKRGIKKVNGNTGWRKMGHLTKKKETDQEDRAKLKVNDVDSIIGA